MRFTARQHAGPAAILDQWGKAEMRGRFGRLETYTEHCWSRTPNDVQAMAEIAMVGDAAMTSE